MTNQRRVVVTGMDVVTPIGVGLEAFWKAALAGTSGVRRIAHFDPVGLPTQIAAALTDQALLEARRVGTDRLERTLPQYLTARLAGMFGAEGPSGTVQTACTSSAQAIGEAVRTIRRGAIDVALAGGAECIVSPIEMQLFSLLGVMSKQ